MSQRERFEAAWFEHEKPTGDHALFMFDRSLYTGKYHVIEVEAAWQSFQLGEASGLELAAQKCDETAKAFKGIDKAISAMLKDLADEIRALLVREVV